MRFRVVLAVLLSVILSGCVSFLRPGLYTGEPAELVIQIRRSAVAPQAFSALASETLDEEDEHEPMHQVVVRIERGSIYQSHHFVDLPADESEALLEVEVPSAAGYRIRAFVHDQKGSVLQEGYVPTVSVSASSGNTVVLQLGPVRYQATIPEVLYSGGKVSQFQLRVPENSLLRNFNILLGLRPWIDSNDWHRIPSGERWTAFTSARFPEVTSPTRVYYQLKLCVPANDLPAAMGNVCFYEPAIGEPLPYVEILPGPPPET